ncbi:site-2 protease family protein [Streptomyces sp. NPDC092369]|uniref:site-2 protease family protein n=1 Tax=Streptomyces sp. NPDC092369 TaxID=3366015 RepID=UPI0038109365
MDESGGSGQPRSGTDESADHHASPAAPAGPADDRPTDLRRPVPSRDKADAETDAPSEPASAEGDPTSGVSRDGNASTPLDPAPVPGTPAEAVPVSGGGSDDGASVSGDRPLFSGAHAEASGERALTPDGSSSASGGSPSAAGSNPSTSGGSPSAAGNNPSASGGNPSASGGTPSAADGSPSAADGHAPVPDEPAAVPDDREPAPGETPATGGHPEAPADVPTAIPAYPHDDDHPTTPTPVADGNRRLARSGGAKQRPPQRPEPRGGLLMGRPFGVPVYVAPSWFLVAALITWVFGGQLDRVLPELGAARYLVSLFFAVAFYASVLIHELAHTVAALRFKLPVRRIQLQFFGGVSEIEKEAETPGREFVLAFVGPLLSLVLSGIFYLAMQPVEPGTVPGVLLAGLMVSNLIVAAFNLLPGLPLDGGRMLRAVVWKITGRPMSGTIAAAWVGRALAVSVLIGLPLLTQSGALGSTAEDNVGMDTVTDALLAAILAAIIWTGAGNSLRMARLREHLPELRARNLTRRAVPVETNTPLSEALRRANSAGARALVVVDPEGTPLSLVREAAIVGVPEHRRPWVAVSGLAQDLTDGMRVSAELAGEDLLDALRATPATEYLVVEETGEIYGVLSAADVERAFVKAMARPN